MSFRRVSRKLPIVVPALMLAIPAEAHAARRSSAARATQAGVLAELKATHALNVKSISLVDAVAATVSAGEAKRLAATQSGKGAAAQALGYTGAGVKVAYIADGIDPNNPDFIRAKGQHVFVDSQDFSGTGTSAPTDGGEAFLDASSIAAQGRHVYDVASYGVGLSVPCRIRILGVAPGASLNESFGSNPFPGSALLDLTKQANDQAIAVGVTVAVSSGDAGVTNAIGSPATDPAVISVGASTTYRACAQAGIGFITTPGVKGWISNNISALSSAGFQAYQQAHHGHRLTPAGVKRIIVSTAQDIKAPAEQQGAGLVDAYAAVLAAKSFPGATQAKAGHAVLVSATQLKLLHLAGVVPTYLVPPLTTKLSARVTAPAKQFFDLSYPFGDPDLISPVGKTASVGLGSTDIPDGDWAVTPFLAGQDGAKGLRPPPRTCRPVRPSSRSTGPCIR